MKKSFLSAIALCSAALLVGACHQPLTQTDDGFSTSPPPGRRAARPLYQDENQGIHEGGPNAADFPDGGLPGGERQDYVDMPENQPIRTTTVRQEEVLPSMTYVNERLDEYGKKLNRWRELDRQSSATAVSPEESSELISCFQQLQKVMNGYSLLRANMLDSMNAGAGKTVSVQTARDLYKTDIDFLESRCGLMLTEKPPTPKIADGPLQATEDTLLRNYAAGNYESAAQLWRALPPEQGVRLRVSAQNAAAQSLLRQGDEKGAATIYRDLLQRLDDEDSPDTLRLRQNLADIALATGDNTLALRQYRLIEDDYKKLGDNEDWANRQAAMITSGSRNDPALREYADIMRRWLIYAPERDGFTVSALADNFLRKHPQSPVSENIEYIRDQTKKKAENWINGLVSSADKLAARKKFEEAANMIDSVPQAIIEGEQKTILKEKSEEIAFAEAVDRETVRQQQEQESQRKWNSGLLLAQNGRYDEAIDAFTELERDPAMGDKAKAKVGEITLKAAQDQRRKAAELYIRYTKIADMDAKKKLLLESRRILKDILVKYPEAEIAAKVTNNIERVEQEIRSIDPELLQYADQPGQAPTTAPSADGGLP
ncbi:MAG: hypothetical protein LBU39_02665 [Desulfobulbaceae bacterium]|jgi:hypothetical protein|nr:hypothetical protein [Desulfobulbaceae bacterium]